LYKEQEKNKAMFRSTFSERSNNISHSIADGGDKRLKSSQVSSVKKAHSVTVNDENAGLESKSMLSSTTFASRQLFEQKTVPSKQAVDTTTIDKYCQLTVLHALPPELQTFLSS